MRQVRIAVYVALILWFLRKLASKVLTPRFRHGAFPVSPGKRYLVDIEIRRRNGAYERWEGVLNIPVSLDGVERTVERLNSGGWKTAFHNYVESVTDVKLHLHPSMDACVGKGYLPFRMRYGIGVYGRLMSAFIFPSEF